LAGGIVEFMEPSSSIEAIALRLLELLKGGSTESDVFSQNPGTLCIGTSPGEWWRGPDEIAAAGLMQMAEFRELGGFEIEVQEIWGYQEASVGWFASQGLFKIGSLTPFPVRVTGIVHQEGLDWRFVHLQFSEPVDSPEVEQTLGRPMTSAVDDILTLVKDNDLPLQALGSDGTVTIMFTDIEGSTKLLESLGEHRWLELLRWHDGVVRLQTGVFGGVVVKGQGDGFMLAFPAVGSATACAIAIQRSLSSGWNGVTLPIRIGLHCGKPSAENGDYFGREVVVAARVSGEAEGGEILVTEAVQQRLGGSIPLLGARILSLKGLTGEFPAFPLIWQ
jgi:adenylate cyclase